MKKLIIISIMCLYLSGVAYAQDAKKYAQEATESDSIRTVIKAGQKSISLSLLEQNKLLKEQNKLLMEILQELRKER